MGRRSFVDGVGQTELVSGRQSQLRKLDHSVETTGKEVIGVRHRPLGCVHPISGGCCRLIGRVELIMFRNSQDLGSAVLRRRHFVDPNDAERGSDREPAVMALVIDRQGDIGAERPTADDQSKVGVAATKLIDGGGDIVAFGLSLVMSAGRCADATKVESQARSAVLGKAIEEAIDDAGRHVATVKRVRVAQHHQCLDRAGGDHELAFECLFVAGLE